MDLNRNQFLFLGIVVLLVGLQVRMVATYVLTSEATQFLAERTGKVSSSQSAMIGFGTGSQFPRKVLQPPEWLGWAIISVGAVFVLHSLAMPKPS
jgi:hypothetical protein